MGKLFVAAIYPFSSPEESSSVEFSGSTSGNVPVFCAIWYDSGYSLRQFTVSVWQQRQVCTVQTVPGPARGDSTGAVLGQIRARCETGTFSAVCVQTVEIPQVQFLVMVLTCPFLCMSRSSTSLSWRRGRFPWSSEQIMRFPCCSPLIRWSISWL